MNPPAPVTHTVELPAMALTNDDDASEPPPQQGS
jgi:hypothetical protein